VINFVLIFALSVHVLLNITNNYNSVVLLVVLLKKHPSLFIFFFKIYFSY